MLAHYSFWHALRGGEVAHKDAAWPQGTIGSLEQACERAPVIRFVEAMVHADGCDCVARRKPRFSTDATLNCDFGALRRASAITAGD